MEREHAATNHGANALEARPCVRARGVSSPHVVGAAALAPAAQEVR
jgi:hypothetical protein